MSKQVDGGNNRGGTRPESGLEGLRQSPAFRGPGVSPDGHDHANDHFALLYERNEEQLAAAIPFIRQGLERGEQCLYVADDNSEERIIEAMRAYDIDVDTALESGALSVLTPADTYRRTGEFDRGTMLEFWEDSLEQVKDEEGYTGLRAAAEMTWALDDDTGSDELVEYEAVLNSLYEDEDYVVMCQYNRERFSAETIHGVIKTHPYLVVDDTISENFYYTPPETFFGGEDLTSKVDRMTETLREHTTAKTELQEQGEFLRELYEITASSDRSFEEKLHAMFELGCDRFDLEIGGMAIVDPATDLFEVEVTNGEHEHLAPGEQYPLSETYCQAAVSAGGTETITGPTSDAFEGKLCHDTFGVKAYLGTYLEFEKTADRTFWFVSSEPRPEGFSDVERTFHHLMGQWVSFEIERREHKRSQQELYEIASDSDRSFDEKVDRLLELGRERFGLDMGFFLEKQGDEFRVRKTRGTGLEEGVATLCANPDHYCKRTITMDAPVGVEDTEAVGWDDDPLYREYDLGCYLGTKVTDGSGVYGSICFADSSSRKQEFSEDAYTFLDLMGQWLSYELERRERETELEETIEQLQQSNDRLKQFAYAASHDLQEPLRMVSSYMQLLENRYKDELDEEAGEYIDFAVDGADRMRAMVDDLLAFARVEQADGEFEQVDCHGVLERVTDDLQVQIEENDAEITVESLPTVRADSEQLEQVFSNLVSNAIKYSGDEPPEVEITVEERATRWEFAVADNGIGIDPEKTDRIFEVFKRLHHDGEYAGTGIGLSLCQEIVENHGGDIWVDSEPGAGSTFCFTIPKETAD